MYKFWGYVPNVRCICGEKHLVIRAVVCKCGTTLRMQNCRSASKVRPLAVAPDKLDLSKMPFRQPAVIEWVEQ